MLLVLFPNHCFIWIKNCPLLENIFEMPTAGGGQAAERGDLLSSLLKMEVDAVEGPQVGEGVAQGGLLGCQPPTSSSWCVKGLHRFRLYQPLSRPCHRQGLPAISPLAGKGC